MQVRVFLAATVFFGATMGAPLSSTDLEWGVAAAEAKAFYTRKRVNGRWITGRFARGGREEATERKTRVPEKAKAADKRQAAVDESDPELPVLPPPRPSSAPVTAAGPLAVAVPSAALLPAAVTATSPEERMRQLRQALEAKAKQMAGIEPPAPGEAAPVAAKFVTFDLEAGVRTIALPDGTVRVEPFDVAAMRALGIVPPARGQNPERTGSIDRPKPVQN